MDNALRSERIRTWVHDHRDEALDLVAKLIQTPSVNNPPYGNEAQCQQVIADWLEGHGAQTKIYELRDVPGLTSHPAYMHGREYQGRPNVVAQFRGAGGGKSLLYSSHIDVVYEGTESWTYPPFAAEIADGKMYGRGSYDMKGGLAASMLAAKCLNELGIKLRGDLYIESVVDEEHGGANGSLAARLHGPNPDMAIIPEPSNMRCYPAHLGGGIWKATLSGKSGIAFNGEQLVSALDATVDFAKLLREFGEYRLARDKAPHWWKEGKKAEVTVISIHSGDHTRELQEKVPSTGELNFWIEGYPGTSGDQIIEDLMAYLDSRLDDYPKLRESRPVIVPLIRYLDASEMPINEETDRFRALVQAAGTRVLNQPPLSECGAPFACDAFMFQLYNDTPALILGPSGGNAHAADEHLDLESYLQLICWYAEIAVDWCGLQEELA